MRLHESPTSPFARKVRIVLIETGLDKGVEQVAAGGGPLDPGTIPLGQNPLGKLPVLERADGPALYDSRVICRFLDDLAGGRLYPPKPRLWETLTLEATADGVLDAAVLMIYEVRTRPEEHRDAPWVEAQWAKGALAGDSPSDAFYVRCDETVNTIESVELGQLIMEIGVAPTQPAEYLILQVVQKNGSADPRPAR